MRGEGAAYPHVMSATAGRDSAMERAVDDATTLGPDVDNETGPNGRDQRRDASGPEGETASYSRGELADEQTDILQDSELPGDQSLSSEWVELLQECHLKKRRRANLAECE